MRTIVLALAALGMTPLSLAAQARSQPDALLDTAMVRMGGRAALEKVARVRLDMMTQWLRTTWDREPGADAPSYELHAEVRDYAIPAWRNTRRFPMPGGGPWREMTDVVRDTVAIRRLATGAPGTVGAADARWQALNVAYVDERRELFAFAPERLLLAARAASDLKGRVDTTVNGVRYRAAAATVGGFPTVMLFDPATGFLAAALYAAAQPNDFGLAPWGTMSVELWYARWQRQRGGVSWPTQMDVMRAGRPYKRMTVLGAAFDVAATPDSFVVADSLRAAYLATQRRPMHDLPMDSARIVEGTFATFGPFGPPAGAVKVGGVWMLLEAGQAPLNAERAVEWLETAETGSGVAGALVTIPYAGSGGVAWLAREGRPLWIAPGARTFVDLMLRGHGVGERPSSATLTTIGRASWVRVGSDSLRLEPIDLPSGRGAMLVYAPTLKWAYAGLLATPLDMDAVTTRIRERGWTVERIGSRRGIAQPVPARTASSEP